MPPSLRVLLPAAGARAARTGAMSFWVKVTVEPAGPGTSSDAAGETGGAAGEAGEAGGSRAAVRVSAAPWSEAPWEQRPWAGGWQENSHTADGSWSHGAQWSGWAGQEPHCRSVWRGEQAPQRSRGGRRWSRERKKQQAARKAGKAAQEGRSWGEQDDGIEEISDEGESQGAADGGQDSGVGGSSGAPWWQQDEKAGGPLARRTLRPAPREDAGRIGTESPLAAGRG